MYISTTLVEQSLATTPKGILIYTRDGEPAMRLSGFNTYYGNGTDCPNILDPFTGQRHPLWSMAAATDSKLPDEQAAITAASPARSSC
ncbi:MAG: hypothetical protein N3A72_10485 [bacterium]|nr:hypothetical protein [bacterium]